MRSKRLRSVFTVFAVALGAATDGSAQTPVPARPPITPEQIDSVSTALRGTDGSAKDKAVEQIKYWVDGGTLCAEVWSTWMPDLARARRWQDVADLSLKVLTGTTAQPQASAIGTVVLFRARSLAALGRFDEALQAAKMYYNVCPFKDTPQAVDLVRVGLVKQNAERQGQQRAASFADEQAKASAAVKPDGTLTGKVDPSPTLAAIKIDPAPFAPALKAFADLQGSVDDRACYADLLLIAGRPADAEAIYREIYNGAGTGPELDLGVEGIARCLRAEDGNLARANAFLIGLGHG